MKVKLLNEHAKLPTRSKTSDAGYDLYAAEEMFIPVGSTRKIKLGIAIELPSITLYPNVVAFPFLKVEDRSSMASKGLRTGGGVVDFGYRGELQVCIHNINNTEEFGDSFWDDIAPPKGYRVKKGDKIAQGIISLAFSSDPVAVEELSETDRGAGGFGSSGR